MMWKEVYSKLLMIFAAAAGTQNTCLYLGTTQNSRFQTNDHANNGHVSVRKQLPLRLTDSFEKMHVRMFL